VRQHWTTFFSQRQRALARRYQAIALTAFSLAAWNLPACADIVRQDGGPIARQLHTPVYVWQDTVRTPRGIVVAIHGLAMHGTNYDTWARSLADDGFVVAAPDLRGYGKWLKTKTTAIAYTESERDLGQLAATLRQRYPHIPLFLAGESLGGTIALRVAARHPDIVDGLILSAPALKHRHHLQWKTIADAAIALADPAHEVDVSPYIKNYYSDNPSICSEEINDPLVRKNLPLTDIMASCRMIADTAALCDAIPPDMPILVMQGQNDRMIKKQSISMLEHHLRSHHASVRVLPNHGHILLETAYVSPEAIATVKDWLNENCHMRTLDGERVAER
jgi:alpha-beta hydrolase superfamily lysophospholipase